MSIESYLKRVYDVDYYKKASSDYIADENKRVPYGYFKYGSNKVGIQRAIIWDGVLTPFVFMDKRNKIKINSFSDNDKGNGTGARKIRITGLNPEYEKIQEEIELNGVYDVFTINLFIRIIEVEVSEVGSNCSNDGDIYLRDESENLQARIIAKMNNTLMALDVVPAGYCGFITQLMGTVERWRQGTLTIKTRNALGIERTKMQFELAENTRDLPLKNPIKIDEKTDIYIEIIAKESDVNVFAGFCIDFIPCKYLNKERP